MREPPFFSAESVPCVTEGRGTGQVLAYAPFVEHIRRLLRARTEWAASALEAGGGQKPYLHALGTACFSSNSCQLACRSRETLRILHASCGY